MPPNLSGRSILPIIKDESNYPSPYFYFTGNSKWGKFNNENDETVADLATSTAYAIRSGRWKGIVDNCVGIPSLEDEMILFDLMEDPFETTNLAELYPEQINALKDIIASEQDISCKCFQC